MSLPINCPKCKRTAYEQMSSVVSYYDPRFECRFCGWKGPLYITNPNPVADCCVQDHVDNLFEYLFEKHLHKC